MNIVNKFREADPWVTSATLTKFNSTEKVAAGPRETFNKLSTGSA